MIAILIILGVTVPVSALMAIAYAIDFKAGKASIAIAVMLAALFSGTYIAFNMYNNYEHKCEAAGGTVIRGKCLDVKTIDIGE